MRTCRSDIQLEKVWFVLEKIDFFRFFQISRQNFRGPNAFEATFFKNLKKNLKNDFARSRWLLKGTMSWKISSFEALPEEPRSKNCRGRSVGPPPRCRIGLISIEALYQGFQMIHHLCHSLYGKLVKTAKPSGPLHCCSICSGWHCNWK